MVVPSNTASDTRDSWSFQSHLSHLYDTSDQVEEMEPYMRISIGAFIGLRTEALGSLDGSTDNRVNRFSSFQSHQTVINSMHETGIKLQH